jgi:hypothetical protein
MMRNRFHTGVIARASGDPINTHASGDDWMPLELARGMTTAGGPIQDDIITP